MIVVAVAVVVALYYACLTCLLLMSLCCHCCLPLVSHWIRCYCLSRTMSTRMITWLVSWYCDSFYFSGCPQIGRGRLCVMVVCVYVGLRVCRLFLCGWWIKLKSSEHWRLSMSLFYTFCSAYDRNRSSMHSLHIRVLVHTRVRALSLSLYARVCVCSAFVFRFLIGILTHPEQLNHYNNSLFTFTFFQRSSFVSDSVRLAFRRLWYEFGLCTRKYTALRFRFVFGFVHKQKFTWSSKCHHFLLTLHSLEPLSTVQCRAICFW